MLCRDKIKESLGIILTGKKQQLYDLVDEFERTFKSSSFEEVARTAGVTDIEKYTDDSTVYSKGCPMHVWGSLLYNRLIKAHRIDDSSQAIRSGDKIKYCYLTLPNPIGEDVISVYDRLPKEFGLDRYIDYDKQFEKVFKDPVNDVAKLVGWDIDNTATLEALFA
jgi:hypothetical protein